MKSKSNIARVFALLMLCCCLCTVALAQDAVRVGLAWKPGITADDRVVIAVELAGGEAVILDQVRPAGFDYDSVRLQSKYVDADGVLLPQYAEHIKRDTWHGSNAEQVLKGVDAVVFLGGADISSTLFREPQPWHGVEGDVCDVTRDLSEYLTMAYCLDHDIPVLGLCRGMQMLGVVSGAGLIQDLGNHYKASGIDYDNLHRSVRDENGKRHYVPHDVVITDASSLLYGIEISDTIRNVPSWHHQVVGDVSGTCLKVTGVTPTQGIDIIEAIERTDKTFALGVQFHPEEAVRKHVSGEDDAHCFMQLYQGVNYFRTLINYTKKLKK